VACAALLGLSVLSAAPSTWAQSQSSIAEAMYQEGRQLMEAGRYAEACPKFEESQKLEPGMGTLLNLATCNEKLGKSATAWSQFSEAYSILTKETDEQRAAYAKERRDSLATSLSKITIQVPQPSRVTGLVVSLDGVAVGSAAWGVAVPVDPGTHTIKAEAAGYKSWEGKFEISARANNSVSVPTLQKAAGAPAAQPNQSSPQPGPAQDPGVEPGRPLGAPVIIAGVATLALTGTAIVTGVIYKSRQKTYDELNNDPTTSFADVDASRKDAEKMGTLNLVTSIGAGVGAVATIVLFVVRPKAKPATTAFSPWVGPEGAGATVLQRF
jgi:hypothetical protein